MDLSELELFDGLKTTGISRVRQQDIGVYIWKLPNGRPLMDDDYNMLSITSRFGDIQKMAALQRVATSYGFPDGTAEWVEGYKCTDDEYEEWIESWKGSDG